MNQNTTRILMIVGLCANVFLLLLSMLDYSLWDSEHMWPIFVSWAFIILMMVMLAFASAGWHVEVHHDHVEAPVARPAPVVAAPARAVEGKVPFIFNGYTLHSRKVELKGGEGESRDIYFFAKSTPKSGHPVGKPAGYHVGVNERTGLPFLKKGAGADGEDLTPEVESQLRPQCSALTEDGKQCRNSARESSKYCASHFGYQPTTARTIREETGGAVGKVDTRPRVRNAPDTTVAVRKAA
jgi:hypothetical protein